MNGSNLFPLLVLFLALSFNLYVHLLVAKNGNYETGQKWAQYGLIWLLPVIGAILCYLCAGKAEDRQAGDDGRPGNRAGYGKGSEHGRFGTAASRGAND